MAGGHGAGIAVRAGGIVIVGVQSVTLAQYVVGILGLPGAEGGATPGRGIALAAPDGTAISAAGRSVLVLAPCGLGLIPIS